MLRKGDIVLSNMEKYITDAIGYDQYSYNSTQLQKESTNSVDYKALVCNGNSLLEAFKKSRSRSFWKPQTQLFEANLLEELTKLQQDILNDTYKISPKTEFILHERGKIRLVHGAHIRDRVFQHSFCDNALLPILKSKLIYDNCASLPGKGISMARKRFKIHLHKFFNKYKNNNGYILLMDFSGYYDNIRHDKLLEELKKTIDDKWVLHMVEICLDSFKQDISFLSKEEAAKLKYGKFKELDYFNVPKKKKTGEKFLYKSLNIGDQCSQLFGIYFPTKIDNFIKIVKQQKFYGRYADDSYIISKDKTELINLLKEIKNIAASLGIILNDNKIKIVKLSNTFRFLQNKYFLTDIGRVVERINPEKVTVERRRLKKHFKNPHMSLIEIENNFKSWKGSFYKFMSKVQRKNLNKLFLKLKGEAIAHGRQ